MTGYGKTWHCTNRAMHVFSTLGQTTLVLTVTVEAKRKLLSQSKPILAGTLIYHLLRVIIRICAHGLSSCC